MNLRFKLLNNQVFQTRLTNKFFLQKLYPLSNNNRTNVSILTQMFLFMIVTKIIRLWSPILKVLFVFVQKEDCILSIRNLGLNFLLTLWGQPDYLLNKFTSRLLCNLSLSFFCRWSCIHLGQLLSQRTGLNCVWLVRLINVCDISCNLLRACERNHNFIKHLSQTLFRKLWYKVATVLSDSVSHL